MIFRCRMGPGRKLNTLTGKKGILSAEVIPMDDRRKSSRRRTLKRGKVILTKWTVMDCLIRNLSEKGARLEFGGPVELPKTFQLELIEEGRTVAAELLWQRGLTAGVSFVQSGASAKEAEAGN